jgi:hypothetical protein
MLETKLLTNQGAVCFYEGLTSNEVLATGVDDHVCRRLKLIHVHVARMIDLRSQVAMRSREAKEGSRACWRLRWRRGCRDESLIANGLLVLVALVGVLVLDLFGTDAGLVVLVLIFVDVQGKEDAAFLEVAPAHADCLGVGAFFIALPVTYAAALTARGSFLEVREGFTGAEVKAARLVTTSAAALALASASTASLSLKLRGRPAGRGGTFGARRAGLRPTSAQSDAFELVGRCCQDAGKLRQT